VVVAGELIQGLLGSVLAYSTHQERYLHLGSRQSAVIATKSLVEALGDECSIVGCQQHLLAEPG
jgi:hypothetical protein